MVDIGIDFSLNSTAVCIEDNDNYFFMNFPSEKYTKIYDELINTDVEIISYEKIKQEKTATYNNIERIKLLNIEQLLKNILNKLNCLDINKIKIEGLSYNSKGLSSLEIAGAQYILRYILKDHKTLFIAPQQVKKTALKGGINKEKMIQLFIDNILCDEKLKNNKFYQSLVKFPERFKTRTDKYKKPIDDLVDSYFILKSKEI